ncbi:7911_t:CDS:10 [Paraglomus brasilianum]|uniref:7911_t:CDS:1 n=1 Tax=Paraglomus brasilianum TaxID=144538 RepID=A0A9N8VMM3_9GLOM|nr:7911_t:CDS:10 [Paraglomus brasilianum]
MFFEETRHPDWSILAALQYISEHSNLYSENIESVLEEMRMKLRTISRQQNLLSHARNKAAAMYSSFDETIKRTVVRNWFQMLEKKEEVESTKLVYREAMKADVLHDKFQVAPEAQLKRKLEVVADLLPSDDQASSQSQAKQQIMDNTGNSDEGDGYESPCETIVRERSARANKRLHTLREDNENAGTDFSSEEYSHHTNYDEVEETGSNLKAILRSYCKKRTTSPHDPAHSFVLDLSPSSKIRRDFSRKSWQELVTSRRIAQTTYHHEIESLLTHLFGRRNLTDARTRWYSLRDLPTPTYSNEFSYAENDWPKICRWVERVTGQFLDAFESSRNPLQNNCYEREWLGGYLVPLLQGALALDGNCRVRWGEASVLSTQHRRNQDRDVFELQVERAHMADLLCVYEQHEVMCLLACGGPDFYDLTKMASDEFNLPRMMKDMLDNLQAKFPCMIGDKKLYIIGIQTYMTEVRLYIMERNEVYRLHFLKSFHLPLTFSAYSNLRVALKWAWNIRGMLNELIKKFEASSDDEYVFISSSDMKTQTTPAKHPKKKGPAH